MRSAAFVGPGRIDLSDVAEPVVGPNDVLLDVEACGVCGSDVGSFLHGHYVEPGQVMGHELSAVVRTVGSAVTGLDVGTRVAIRPMKTCGTCDACTSGRTNLCAASVGRSLGYGVAGGFAEAVLIRDAEVGLDLYPVPSDVGAHEVVWCEPLAVAVHAVRLAAIEPGASWPVLVVGAGSVGLCVAAAVRALAGVPVVVVEPRGDRRAAAASLGAEGIAPQDLAARGFLAAIETSGRAAVVRSTMDVLEPGGRLVLVGLGDEPVPTPDRGVTVTGSFAYTDDDFRTAVELVVSGRVRLGAFVTHRFGLAETGEAIAASAADPHVVKAVVVPTRQRSDQ